MPVITLTTTAVIAGVSFVMQGFNSWRGAKHAKKLRKMNCEYEKAMRNRQHQESRALFQKMVEARKEIARMDREENLKLLQISHDETIKAIAEKSIFSRWPLHVHPLVIRNDYPLMANEEFLPGDAIEPVHVIMLPTRDESFRKNIQPEVKEKLDRHFARFYNSRTSHRVIFYKDEWIDESADVDETDVRNIYSRIRNTPVIVFGFKVKKDRLVLEVSHWGINGLDQGPESAGSVFCQPVDFEIFGCDITRNREYGLADVEVVSSQLSNELSLITGMLVDKVMWNRYLLPPMFPSALKNGLLDITDEDMPVVYNFYSNMLAQSLDSALVSRFIDCNPVLSYSLSVDGPLNGTLCFETLLGENQIETFSVMEHTAQFEYLKAIVQSDGLYSSPRTTELMYNCWFKNALWAEVCEITDSDNRYSLRSLDQVDLEPVWKSYVKTSLASASHVIINECLDELRANPDPTMPRVIMRGRLNEKAVEAASAKIFPVAASRVVDRIKKASNEKFKKLVKEQVSSLQKRSESFRKAFPELGFNVDYKSMAAELVAHLDENLSFRLEGVKPDAFSAKYREDIEKALSLCTKWQYKVAEDWITYVFMGKDIIHTWLSFDIRQKHNEMLFTDLESVSTRMFADFLDKVRSLDASRESNDKKMQALGNAFMLPLFSTMRHLGLCVNN